MVSFWSSTGAILHALMMKKCTLTHPHTYFTESCIISLLINHLSMTSQDLKSSPYFPHLSAEAFGCQFIVCSSCQSPVPSTLVFTPVVRLSHQFVVASLIIRFMFLHCFEWMNHIAIKQCDSCYELMSVLPKIHKPLNCSLWSVSVPKAVFSQPKWIYALHWMVQICRVL